MRHAALLVLLLALCVSACSDTEQANPEEVWTEFVGAVNTGDINTVEELLAAEVEWTWDSNMLVIHRAASGREETVAGIEDLVGRGVTFDTEVVEVVGDTLTAETLFLEPGLADFLGGQLLVQVDVVTISDGKIVTWSSTADETVPPEE